MDNQYANTVRLLLTIVPEVFHNDILAMKGGTAINLFVQEMPRLSVDIDVVYTPRNTIREEALTTISLEMGAIADRVRQLGLAARLIRSNNQGESKLIVENDIAQVKVETNIVFRGTLLPVETRPLNDRTSDLFGVELNAPILTPDELYAGKLVAALDRQHPRDLFDVWQLLSTGAITDRMLDAFVVYLAGHNRPIHEVLFSRDKDISREYQMAFVGMTDMDCPLETLITARTQLRILLMDRLTFDQRQFLIGMSRAEPNWSFLRFPEAEHLPALKWKLANLNRFKARRPADFDTQATYLESELQ